MILKTADVESVAHALYEHNWRYCHGNTDPYQENCANLWKSWLPYARVAIEAHEKALKERGFVIIPKPDH